MIASISLLEVFLRRHVDVPSGLLTRRVPFPTLLEFAQGQGLLRDVPTKRIVEWLRVRNRVVHGQGKPSKSMTESIVSGVRKIVGNQ